MKYIGKALLSFLLVVSVLLGSNSFYANAQTGDNAGLSASDTETSFSNPISLSDGQYRVKLDFFGREDGEYVYYDDRYTLSTYGLLTVANGSGTLKIKKYGYSGSYVNLFLKSEEAVKEEALVNDGNARFPAFAAEDTWAGYSSEERYFTDLYEESDFYGTDSGLITERVAERNAVYFTVPIDLQSGCIGYFSWEATGTKTAQIESYYIVPDLKTAVSLETLQLEKEKNTTGYRYTENYAVENAKSSPSNPKLTNLNKTLTDFDILESEVKLESAADNTGLTAIFTINEKFTGDNYKAVKAVDTSPKNNSNEMNSYRWSDIDWTENIPVENNSFSLNFDENEIIFGKELRIRRNKSEGKDTYLFMTVVPLTDELQIIDVVDEKSGITFRYSNHDIQTGDIQVEAEKLEEKAEVPEELWNSVNGNSTLNETSVLFYKLKITYADGTPIPQYKWNMMSYRIFFSSDNVVVGSRMEVTAFQEQRGWNYDDFIYLSGIDDIKEGQRPWLSSNIDVATELEKLGLQIQDKDAMYHAGVHNKNLEGNYMNYSVETYAMSCAMTDAVDIEDSAIYPDGVYTAKAQLFRQQSAFPSACANLMDDDVIIVIENGKKYVYLNFTEEGEVAFGSGYYQGGLKAYDNTTNAYIEDSEVVYSYMCNSDGTLLDNTSYNALTEFPCILSTRITLDSRSLYEDESLTGHYRMGIISPVMAAMGGTAYADVEPIGVDLVIVTAPMRVADIDDEDWINSIPTYQKSVLMRSIQRGDLYLEGRKDYAADAVTALESAVEAGRTYYYNDLKDVDNKSAVKEQSDRIKELSDAIESAITALGVLENVDKSALEAAINEANALTEGEYTTLSWGALSKALSDAVVTNNRADVSQSVVDAEVENLKAAMAALEKRSEDAMNPATLSDGVYRIPVGLYKNSNVKSVSDAALDVAYLEVKDGQAKVTLSFAPWEDGAVNLTALSTLSNVTAQAWNSYEIASCDKTAVEPTETYTVGETSYPKEMVLDVTLPDNLDSGENYIWTETTVRSGENETTEYARLYLDYTGIVNVTDAKNALDAAQNYAQSEYTADSWKTFTDAVAALEEAIAVEKDKAVLQTAVDALANAQKALVKVNTSNPQQPSTQSPQQTTQAPQTGQQTLGSQQPVAGMVGEKFKVNGNTYQLTSNGTQATAALVKGSKKKAKVVIPSAVKKNGVTVYVTAIGNNAFKNRKKVKTVVIGKNVQRIGKKAFAGCRNLRKITVKSRMVRMVGKKAFQSISSRAVIKVPKQSLKRYQKLFRNKGQRRTVKIR